VHRSSALTRSSLPSILEFLGGSVIESVSSKRWQLPHPTPMKKQAVFFVKLTRQLGLANQFSLLGLLCKFFFQRGGHVAARELICMNLHPLDNVLYRETTFWKVLYETAPTRQGFVPMVQLPLTVFFSSCDYLACMQISSY
jgi:hypothetical protein